MWNYFFNWGIIELYILSPSEMFGHMAKFLQCQRFGIFHTILRATKLTTIQIIQLYKFVSNIACIKLPSV